MRVASMSQYQNFNTNQQKLLSDMLDVNNQISSGKKIQFGYEETSTYLDFLRFDTETKALEQVSDTSQKAANFSENTDVAINSTKKTLETFKIKLLDAANGTHSKTSLNAIGNDLEALRNSMLDIVNSSVGGNYLFSGTNFKQKPFTDEGKYVGNNENIKAQVGNGVEIPYNTTGLELAYGYTSDYSKKITTNVVKYNMTDLEPKVLNAEDPNKVPEQNPIEGTNTIRDLVGQPDDTQNTFFYIRGKKPDGSGVKEKFEMSNYGTVNDLMEKIGREFGNTEIYKAVEVGLSEMGQIEITDVKTGQLMTDFHIVASNISVNDLDTLEEHTDAHIYSFNDSGFAYSRDSSIVGAEQDFYDDRMFKFNTTLRRIDSEALATKFDSANSVLSEDVDTFEVTVNGTTFTHSVVASTTVEDLLGNIEADIEGLIGKDVDVAIQNGVVSVFDRFSKDGSSITELSLSTKNSVTGAGVDSFAGHSSLSYDKARFEKVGSVLTSNVSQIDRTTNKVATEKTQVINVASTESLEEQVLRMDLLDVNGDKKVVEVTLRDFTNDAGQLSTFRLVEPTLSQEFDIFDEYGKQTPASSFTYTELRLDQADVVRHNRETEGLTYKQLLSVMEIAISDNIPTTNDFEAYKTAVSVAEKQVDARMNEFGQIELKDLTTSESHVQFSMFGEDTNIFDNYSKVVDKGLIQSYSGLKEEQGWDLVDTDLTQTLDVTFGFPFTKDLTLSGTDVNGNAVSTTLTQGNTLQDLLDAIDNTFGDGVGIGGFVSTVEDGKLILRDNTSSDITKVDVNFNFGDSNIDMLIEKSPPFTFSANNALNIVDGDISFFESLDMAIEAVRSGTIRADSKSGEPRSIGIQNSIASIDQILDHLNRVHTENGAVTTSLNLSFDKAELTKLNVQELSSMTIDTNIGEATVKLNQRAVAYQSLLGIMGKISQLNLINYI